jgi:UDP-glucose 4-epimerase
LEVVRQWVDVIEGDLQDPDAVRRAVDGARVIFHQAAVSSVLGSIADPHLTMEVHLTGTLIVLEAARDAGCQRVVNASSAAV